MHLTKVLLLASSATAITVPSFADISSLFARQAGGTGSCPAVWTQVSAELTTKFLTDGQCNPSARAAIRAVFHDCGVFAGSHAIVTCPGGPRVQTYVGRSDSSTPAPAGLLPDVHASADSLHSLFQDKGLSAVDLAALLGAHSTSNQYHFDESPADVGAPQDSTPGVWDVKYYSDTTAPPKGVVVLPSDQKLAAHATVGREFKAFVGNTRRWNGRFADAMARMERFGSDGLEGLVDCTGSLPFPTHVKREMRGMPLFAPRH